MSDEPEEPRECRYCRYHRITEHDSFECVTCGIETCCDCAGRCGCPSDIEAGYPYCLHCGAMTPDGCMCDDQPR